MVGRGLEGDTDTLCLVPSNKLLDPHFKHLPRRPFYTLLMSANKPSHKNKSQQHLDTFVLHDTGASILLAPISIAQELGMRIDRTELVSVRGANRKEIKVIGTSYIYMRDKVSPFWRRVMVVVTESGENFSLSCSDLKNLDLMSKNFPEYIGQRRGAHA